jgi:hypothetical protein
MLNVPLPLKAATRIDTHTEQTRTSATIFLRSFFHCWYNSPLVNLTVAAKLRWLPDSDSAWVVENGARR